MAEAKAKAMAVAVAVAMATATATATATAMAATAEAMGTAMAMAMAVAMPRWRGLHHRRAQRTGTRRPWKRFSRAITDRHVRGGFTHALGDKAHSQRLCILDISIFNRSDALC